MLKPRKTSNSEKRCYINTALIMLIGWSSAVIIFMTAEGVIDDPLSEFENSKQFLYELERMGGKTALVANYINKWFAGLWHGESLAYTVAFITLVIALGYFILAPTDRNLASTTNRHQPHEDNLEF